MQKLYLLDAYFDNKLINGLDRINQLEWNITVRKTKDGQAWIVYTGDQPIFKTDARAALEAFLYGMGLAYIVLPEDLFAELKSGVEAL